MDNFDVTRKRLKYSLSFLFFCYIIMLVYVLFFYSSRTYTYNNINLIPFRTIMLYIKNFSYFSFSNWFLNLFGNILLFMPFSFILPLLIPWFKKFIPLFLLSLILICGVEFLQNYFRVGEMDVDDILLNMIGVVLGFICYKIVYYFYSKLKKRKKS